MGGYRIATYVENAELSPASSADVCDQSNRNHYYISHWHRHNIQSLLMSKSHLTITAKTWEDPVIMSAIAVAAQRSAIVGTNAERIY
jgi:hypothetical protein